MASLVVKSPLVVQTDALKVSSIARTTGGTAVYNVGSARVGKHTFNGGGAQQATIQTTACSGLGSRIFTSPIGVGARAAGVVNASAGQFILGSGGNGDVCWWIA